MTAPPPIEQSRLDANWRVINLELDAPRASRVERVLRTIGVPAHITRLVVATPALRRSWYLALAGTLLIGLGSADPSNPRQSLLPLLVIAPLVPVLGVAMAYGPSSDPGYEMQLATPMRGLRLLGIRTVVVVGISGILVTLVAWNNPVARPFAAAWLLPSLGVTGLSVMLMTWMVPRRSAVTAAGAWLAIVFVSQVGTDPLIGFTLVGQFVATVVAVTTTLVAAIRRERFDRLEVAA